MSLNILGFAVSRCQTNAVRKEEVEEMASPVQEVISMPTAVAVKESKDTVNIAAHQAPNRAMAPIVILGVLVVLFFVSPYLPTGVREYISALVR